MPGGPGALLATVGRLLRDWRVLLWLVVLVPALLYLVVGGFPATRGLQGMFRTSAGSWLLVACSAAGIVLLVRQLIPLVWSRGAWLSAPAGETVGRWCVRVAIGAGAVVAGVALVAAASNRQQQG